MRHLALLCVILVTLCGCSWYSMDRTQVVNFNAVVYVHDRTDGTYWIPYMTSTKPEYIISNILNYGVRIPELPGFFISPFMIDSVSVNLVTDWNDLNREKRKQFKPYR